MRPREQGTALVLVIFSVMLLTGLASALTLLSVTETGISANYREGVRALYGADAAVGRALVDLRAVDDWTPVLSGQHRSSFTDGAAGGIRRLAGLVIDLDRLTRGHRCGQAASCDPGTPTAERPWGLNNPLWQLYAWGPLGRLAPGAPDGDIYVVVWVADDPDETDALPLADEVEVDRPGHGVIRLLAQAFGPAGARRTVEVTLARRGWPPGGDAGEPASTGTSYLQMVSWREVR